MRNRAWRHGRPASFGGGNCRPAFPGTVDACLPTGVSQLDSRGGPLRAHEFDRWSERLSVRVGPKAEVLGRDAPFGHDGRRLGENERASASGEAAEMDQMPGGGQTIPL